METSHSATDGSSTHESRLAHAPGVAPGWMQTSLLGPATTRRMLTTRQRISMIESFAPQEADVLTVSVHIAPEPTATMLLNGDSMPERLLGDRRGRQAQHELSDAREHDFDQLALQDTWIRFPDRVSLVFPPETRARDSLGEDTSVDAGASAATIVHAELDLPGLIPYAMERAHMVNVLASGASAAMIERYAHYTDFDLAQVRAGPCERFDGTIIVRGRSSGVDADARVSDALVQEWAETPVVVFTDLAAVIGSSNPGVDVDIEIRQREADGGKTIYKGSARLDPAIKYYARRLEGDRAGQESEIFSAKRLRDSRLCVGGRWIVASEYRLQSHTLQLQVNGS